MFFYKYYLEIKNRLLLLLLTGISTVLVSYYYKEILLFLIINPTTTYSLRIQNSVTYFIFTDVTEVFSVFFNVILFSCTHVVALSFIYQVIIFFSPGLFKAEYYLIKSVLKLLLLSICFLIIVFNLVLLPFSWFFFLSFQEFVMLDSTLFHFEAKLNEYLTFYTEFYFVCLFYCLTMVLIFAFYILQSDVTKFKLARRNFYYLFVLFSTLLTPPDVLSQCAFSVFSILGYEFLVFSVLFKSYAQKLVG